MSFQPLYSFTLNKSVLSPFLQVPAALSVSSASSKVLLPLASVSDLQRVNMLGMRRLGWRIGVKNSLKSHKMAMFFVLSLLAVSLLRADNCGVHLAWRREKPTRILQSSLGSGRKLGFERIVSLFWNFYIDGRQGFLSVATAGCTISGLVGLSLRSEWVCRTWVGLSVRVLQ